MTNTVLGIIICLSILITVQARCRPAYCGPHGRCAADGSGCVCDEDWVGERCRLNERRRCENWGQCQNNGTCKVRVLKQTKGRIPVQIYCVCQEDYAGRRCEYNKKCKNIKCENNGTCDSSYVPPRCICSPNYSGSRCETKDFCLTEQPCLNGGTCVWLNKYGENEEKDLYRCVCPPGYSGHTCAIH